MELLQHYLELTLLPKLALNLTSLAFTRTVGITV